MIRAILKKGKIRPVDGLPEHWHDGQDLFIESCEPSDDPTEIKKWYEKLRALSARIPASDNQRLAATLGEHDRDAKE